MRLLLAVTVVINHTGPLFGLVFTDAYLALKTFFIISGFYMALILSEKYRGPGRYRLFITNRLLRLYPTYWVVLLFSLGISLFYKTFLHTSLLLGPWKTWGQALSPASLLAVITANCTILGQDLLFFTHLDTATGALAFSVNALNQSTPAWFFLLIPQAWTLSLELCFYFMAPWLVRRSNITLAVLVAIGFALRLWVYGAGLPFDPWKQRFFPVEFEFFLLGIFSYRLYGRLKGRAIPAWVLRTVGGLYLSALVFYQFLPEILRWEFLLYGATVVCLPVLFFLTRKSTLDRAIGELSYPVYIVHWTVILLVEYSFGTKHLVEWSIVFSVAAAALLNRLVVDRIELYRQKRVLAEQ